MVFKAPWDYAWTFGHTDYYISCPDLYMQWLSHYWAFQKTKQRNPRFPASDVVS